MHWAHKVQLSWNDVIPSRRSSKFKKDRPKLAQLPISEADIRKRKKLSNSMKKAKRAKMV